MKKIFSINMLFLLVLSLVVCANTATFPKNFDTTLYDANIIHYEDSLINTELYNTNDQSSIFSNTNNDDNSEGVSFTESDLPIFSDNPTINHQYYESIVILETSGYLPNGIFIYNINSQYYNDYKKIAYLDEVAVYDINDDGYNELLIKIGGTGKNDNILYVFSYKNNNKFEFLFQIPARGTFFDNNIVKVDDYNMQFKQYFEDFHPYSCLIINPIGITNFAHVEQLFLTEENYITNFPHDYDLNKNNVIYEIRSNDNSSIEYLDDENYHEWEKKFFSNPKSILFYPIT